MNANYKRVPTRFGPETRFDVKPNPPVPFRAAQENELEQLKKRLLMGALKRFEEPDYNAYIRRAANEAAAIAWVTPYPLLTFPELFAEKTNTALIYARRQESVRERSAGLVLV